MKVDAAVLSQHKYERTTDVNKAQSVQVAVGSNKQEVPLSSKELIAKGKNEPYNVSISEKAIIQMIEKANQRIQGVNTAFEYSIHEGTHEIVVKVINRDTNELIREIPSEKILDMVAKMWEMAGLFVDERG